MLKYNPYGYELKILLLNNILVHLLKYPSMFPKLVNMLYAHLSYKDGVITTEVCKTPIYLYFEEFTAIYDLSISGSFNTSKVPNVVEYFNFSLFFSITFY